MVPCDHAMLTIDEPQNVNEIFVYTVMQDAASFRAPFWIRCRRVRPLVPSISLVMTRGRRTLPRPVFCGVRLATTTTLSDRPAIATAQGGPRAVQMNWSKAGKRAEHGRNPATGR